MGGCANGMQSVLMAPLNPFPSSSPRDRPFAFAAAFAAAGLADGAPYHLSKGLMNGYTQVLAKAYPEMKVRACVCADLSDEASDPTHIYLHVVVSVRSVPTQVNACSPGFIETILPLLVSDVCYLCCNIFSTLFVVFEILS